MACETARQERVQAEICGPVEIRIEGFEPVFSEVLFIEMQASEGQYQPLIGYIVLEQSQAAVDMLGIACYTLTALISGKTSRRARRRAPFLRRNLACHSKVVA